MKSTPSFFEYQLISQEWCICLVGTGCHQLHFAEDETRIHSSNGWGIFSNRVGDFALLFWWLHLIYRVDFSSCYSQFMLYGLLLLRCACTENSKRQKFTCTTKIILFFGFLSCISIFRLWVCLAPWVRASALSFLNLLCRCCFTLAWTRRWTRR